MLLWIEVRVAIRLAVLAFQLGLPNRTLMAHGLRLQLGILLDTIKANRGRPVPQRELCDRHTEWLKSNRSKRH